MREDEELDKLWDQVQIRTRQLFRLVGIMASDDQIYIANELLKETFMEWWNQSILHNAKEFCREKPQKRVKRRLKIVKKP